MPRLPGSKNKPKVAVPPTPEYSAKISTIGELLSKVEETKISGYYQIGTHVNEIMTKSEYGKPKFAAVAAQFNVGRDTLRPARVIARRFTEAEFLELASLSGKNGQKLTWTHVVSLSRLKDAKKMTKLAQLALDENWTARQLNARVIEQRGGPLSKGGRRAKVDSDPIGSLTQVQKGVRALSKRLDLTFNNALTMLEKLGQRAKDGTLPSDIDDTMTAVVEDMTAGVQKLNAAIADVERMQNRLEMTRAASVANSLLNTKEDSEDDE